MRLQKATADTIAEAARIVKEGGVIVYPTDTVYGLGCNPFNEGATKRILSIKGERTKPLPILASDIAAAKRIAGITGKAIRLAKRFWPGQLTMVLSKRVSLPDAITRNLDSVAVRVPNHRVALELIRMSGGLLVGTSANRTGKKPPQTATEAAGQIGDEVDLVIDDGPTPLGASSTIVDLTHEKLRILRQGSIKLEDILTA